jgi:sugar phosphate isomerase/epimerase
MHTELALLEVARLGIQDVEIFLNSVGELSGKVFSAIRGTVREFGLNIMAVHPFSSPLETLFLFSSYDRRVDEIMELYKRYFEMMNRLGSRIFVVHGALASSSVSDERYVERFGGLAEAGRAAGITVALENVSYCRSGSLDFLELLSHRLGESAAFVLDVKQARRSGVEPGEIVTRLGAKIVHIHMSDAGIGGDCLPVGAGEYDFAGLFALLREVGYGGGAVVELYRENFGEIAELSDCVENLRKLLQRA